MSEANGLNQLLDDRYVIDDLRLHVFSNFTHAITNALECLDTMVIALACIYSTAIVVTHMWRYRLNNI